MSRFNLVFEKEIPVEAFNENWESVGEYPNIRKAANKLFINKHSSIWQYLFKGNKIRPKRGVKSKVTGNLYHFKLK